MLQSIRDHTQGWIAGVIVTLLIISFALWGIHSYFTGGANTNIVARVNGMEITKSQLTMTYERMRRQFQTQFSTSNQLSDTVESMLRKQALQSLIDIQALKQASLEQKYRVSINQVDDYLEHIPDFQVNGQFSMARFQQLLVASLLSAQDFLELIRTSLLIDQPRLGIIFSSFALPEEILDTFALVSQERDISYTLLPYDAFSNQPVTISDESIQNYYNQHTDEYRTHEQVSIEYLQLSLRDLASKIQPTDAVLKNFYNENSGSYSEPIRWKLDGIIVPASEHPTQEEIVVLEKNTNELYNKAKEGTDFLSLLRDNSFAKKVDEKLLSGWVTLNQVPIQWQSALLSLTKPGQVSTPIQTGQGIVILKVTAYQAPVVLPFEKVKDKVKETYVHQQAEEKFAELKEKLSNLTYEHPDTLETAAKTLGLSINKSEVFTKEKGGKDISSNVKIREIAFSNDVLNQQNNSDVLQINPDTLVVLRVNSHAPATLLPLNAVRSQIEENLKNKEIEIKTLQLAEEIKDKLLHGAAINDVAQQYHLIWNNVGFIGRHSNKVSMALLNTAFEMPQPAQGKLSVATSKASHGYAVIILNAVRDGSMTNSDKQQYKVFAEQIQNSQGLLEYELYKQSQLNKTKIEVENS